MSARRLQLLLIGAAVLVLAALAAPSLADAVRAQAMAGVRLVPGAPSPTVLDATFSAPAAPAPVPTTAAPPERPRELFVLSDSVVLGVTDVLARRLPGWQVTVEGEIGLTLLQATDLLETRVQRVAPTVVVALGYNTVWERDRRHFEQWAAQFDRQADHLVAQLRSLGAKEIVWVTVRELDPEIVPSGWRSQLGRYGFYFPYVNERLRALPQRNPDVRLADWSAASQQPGLTTDAIHVNPDGAELLVDVITEAAGIARATPPSPADASTTNESATG